MTEHLYRCPQCGHEECLDPDDWQESLPACPVEFYDPVNDEMTGDAACPDSYMRPVLEAESPARTSGGAC